MPNVGVTVAGRRFEVACQPGEEAFLHTAAEVLDAEAQALAGASARLGETLTLLMAGLLLADRHAGTLEKLRAAEAELAARAPAATPVAEGVAAARLRAAEDALAARDARIAELEARPPAEVTRTVEIPVEVPVERVVEVPTVPPQMLARLRALADEAEALGA